MDQKIQTFKITNWNQKYQHASMEFQFVELTNLKCKL